MAASAVSDSSILFFSCLFITVFVFTYLGRKRFDFPSQPHDPRRGLSVPYAILVALIIWISLTPEGWAGGLVVSQADAYCKLSTRVPYRTLAWINNRILLSLIAILLGIVFLRAYWFLRRSFDTLPLFDGRPSLKNNWMHLRSGHLG